MEVILASSSPRRIELMKRLDIPFTVRKPLVDETLDPNAETIQDALMEVSYRKATAVERGSDDLVIAADTAVYIRGTTLGKPISEYDALRTLTILSGERHAVVTAMTLLRGDKEETVACNTGVDFRDLTRLEIMNYIATGEGMDKAGAYAIQGRGGLFVTGIEGDYYNILGLPISKLWEMLEDFAPELLEGRR